jgi:hypothetical protein
MFIARRVILFFSSVGAQLRERSAPTELELNAVSEAINISPLRGEAKQSRSEAGQCAC